MLATLPYLDMKELRGLQRQFWNAFKHATTRDGKERDDRKLLERFNDLQNDHTLFVGWYDYMLAVRSMPVEAQVFQAWYFTLYPEKLNPSTDRAQYDAIFPGLRNLSRGAQKKALKKAIAKVRRDKAVMQDRRTDRQRLTMKQ